MHTQAVKQKRARVHRHTHELTNIQKHFSLLNCSSRYFSDIFRHNLSPKLFSMADMRLLNHGSCTSEISLTYDMAVTWRRQRASANDTWWTERSATISQTSRTERDELFKSIQREPYWRTLWNPHQQCFDNSFTSKHFKEGLGTRSFCQGAPVTMNCDLHYAICHQARFVLPSLGE